MKLPRVVRRELEVAFSGTAQSARVRILKYLVLGLLMWFFWRYTIFWIILSAALALSLLVHFWYRYKTAAWTRSYGGWDYEKNRSKLL
jgi:hypothetical protein